MGCLTVCRWCCCCFLAAVNVLSTILGIGFLVLGGITIWGYALLRQATDEMLKNIAKTMQETKMDVTIDINSIHKAIESLFASTAVIFLVLGVLLIVISCLGCCGACFGVQACLIIYSVIVGLLFLAQTTLVIIWFTNSNMIKGCIRSSVENKVANYKGIQNMDLNTLQVDIMQIGMKCCGVDSGDDYYKPGAKWNRTVTVKDDTSSSRVTISQGYPFSCCKYSSNGGKMLDSKCSYANVTTEFSNYRVGCYEKVNEILDKTLLLNNFFCALAGSLGVEALLIIGALVIYFYKKQEQADIPHSGVQYKMQPQMA